TRWNGSLPRLITPVHSAPPWLTFTIGLAPSKTAIIRVMEMKPPPLKVQISGTQIRRIILDQSRRAHVGHIGSALSVADIIGVLYGEVLRISSPEDPERDRFILSNGHAALSVY